MSEAILCDEHGTAGARFLCQHLTPTSEGLGVLIGPERENAYCLACAHVWDEEGGWTPTVDAQMRVQLVCEHCFEEIVSRNEVPGE